MHLKKIGRLLALYRVLFVRQSFFYKFSLNRSPGFLGSSKFMADPWIGDHKTGQEIMDNGLDVTDVRYRDYITSFSWIRDLQVIGGNNNRKYARMLISSFISSYRQQKQFWLDTSTWNNVIVAERVVNWIFSYSFFASGANDRFQMEVLSSITEQFSHLEKIYNAEFNPFARLMILRAILFCYCSSNTSHTKRARKILRKIREVIDDYVDDNGMFFSESPVDHFHVFRSLLEIRFVAKNAGLDISEEGFTSKLSKMAAVVRFFRLCDGSILSHYGTTSVFTPSKQMIDTALSIVDVKAPSVKPYGFERLETKKSTVIINTKPRSSASKFNDEFGPGINIFDFELSFGQDKIFDMADIVVALNGCRIKLNDSARCFSKKSMKGDLIFFESETQFNNRFFDFALRREIDLSISKQRLTCSDFLLASLSMEGSLRFVFNRDTDVRRVSKKSILVIVNKHEYMFSIVDGDIMDVMVSRSQEPIMEISYLLGTKKEQKIVWSIESVE